MRFWSRKRKKAIGAPPPAKPRPPRQHIVIIDGTLSKLEHGKETNCGRLFKLLQHVEGYPPRVYYDPGVQGTGWYKWLHIWSGKGINRSIRRSYLRLCENYQPGDQIYLFGYSRGAYAARVIASFISEFGLLTRRYATRSYVQKLFDLYTERPSSQELSQFRERFTIAPIPIEFIGVWDTVKALGLPCPALSRFSPLVIEFRDQSVPVAVRNARQALARDETRRAYRPVLWSARGTNTTLKQVLFPGTHGIVGGQVTHIRGGQDCANPSFVWMLSEAEAAGMTLPTNWRERFPLCLDQALPPDPAHKKWYWVREARQFTPPHLFTESDAGVESSKNNP